MSCQDAWEDNASPREWQTELCCCVAEADEDKGYLFDATVWRPLMSGSSAFSGVTRLKTRARWDQGKGQRWSTFSHVTDWEQWDQPQTPTLLEMWGDRNAHTFKVTLQMRKTFEEINLAVLQNKRDEAYLYDPATLLLRITLERCICIQRRHLQGSSLKPRDREIHGRQSNFPFLGDGWDECI